ncbi:TrmH family RNA methyltransferase [Methanomicrobium sp. W14]|uniref:RNA methyltransferase n=1 Tax=Methanomicrobium sp. W14 TaxID=2817839 RepID=UPI001AE1066B|nr:RNA methyltransferase [Methanomicrobium sp. W14]MBP2132942.1 TrmH family RNA methyltransferase [Methanomicrobium sp. W14]
MPEIEIVLCEPLYEGNIGFTARVMKNFGFSDLTLINPPEIGDEAIARSSHARDVLENSKIVESLDDVIKNSSLLVATTGETSKSVSTSMRMPYYSPAELRERIKDIKGRVSIIFGRENWGLSNEEISKCDIICTIPTSHEYPILNISHAVGVVVYELANIPPGTYSVASRVEMDYLYSHFSEFLDTIDHREYKRENTMIMLRRIFGRAALTTREASTLHGLLRRTENIIKGVYEPENETESNFGSSEGSPDN